RGRLDLWFRSESQRLLWPEPPERIDALQVRTHLLGAVMDDVPSGFVEAFRVPDERIARIVLRDVLQVRYERSSRALGGECRDATLALADREHGRQHSPKIELFDRPDHALVVVLVPDNREVVIVRRRFLVPDDRAQD